MSAIDIHSMSGDSVPKSLFGYDVIDFLGRGAGSSIYVVSDLKTNNILVGPDGKVKVIDFGQACKTGTCKERIQGTPDYIAPEQVKREAVTFRTDVFNFGATMYWTVTGQKIPTLFTLKKDEN